MLLKKVSPVSWRSQARAAPCAPIPAPLPAPACLPSWQTHLCFSYGLINPSMWQTLHLAITGHQIVGSQLETQRFSKFPHLQPTAHIEKGQRDRRVHLGQVSLRQRMKLTRVVSHPTLSPPHLSPCSLSGWWLFVLHSRNVSSM